MAENRGGTRPTAPQNNPANVNGLGGNGTSGEYTGFPYGMNQTINQSIVEGNAAVNAMKTPTPTLTDTGAPSVPSILDETAFTQTPVTDGAVTGPGLNYVPGLPTNPSNDPDINLIRDQLPIITLWASMPGTSRATSEYANYLPLVIGSGEQSAI